MLNWSPMGRNGSKDTRKIFESHDKENSYRLNVIEDLERYIKSQRIKVVVKLGGDTSFDIYPLGWDKTYCLRHLDVGVDDICFFGDRCFPGGNDYELYRAAAEAHHVKGPQETLKIVTTKLREQEK